MSNRTAIIIIPPVRDSNTLNYCNDFLKHQYTDEHGWKNCPSFSWSETPFIPKVLVGDFSYFHLDEFILYLQEWFIPKPEYSVVDKTEKPTKRLSQLYVQTNRRWGIFQLIIRREHDNRFWLMNIGSDGCESFGDTNVDTE